MHRTGQTVWVLVLSERQSRSLARTSDLVRALPGGALLTDFGLHETVRLLDDAGLLDTFHAVVDRGSARAADPGYVPEAAGASASSGGRASSHRRPRRGSSAKLLGPCVPRVAGPSALRKSGLPDETRTRASAGRVVRPPLQLDPHGPPIPSSADGRDYICSA